MGFDPVTREQRDQFFKHNYKCHLPGYTGHCPTLKFRVGKRFGANTEDIMRELIEERVLKSGPYKPPTDAEILIPITREKDVRRDWKNEAHLHKATPYILGYTGYIPGFKGRYGLSFRRAVEEGAVEWRQAQNKLRSRRDALRSQVEQTNPRNMLAWARTDRVNGEINHGHGTDLGYFGNHVSPERPPIVGYTGHIPGARGQAALSKRYAQAAKKGLEFLQRERNVRHSNGEGSPSAAYNDATDRTRA